MLTRKLLNSRPLPRKRTDTSKSQSPQVRSRRLPPNPKNLLKSMNKKSKMPKSRTMTIMQRLMMHQKPK